LTIKDDKFEEYSDGVRAARKQKRDAGCGYHGDWSNWLPLQDSELQQFKNLDIESIQDIRPIGYIESFRNTFNSVCVPVVKWFAPNK